MQASSDKLSQMVTRPVCQPVTRKDLLVFKTELKEELLKEIKLLLKDQPQPPPKKWIKNKAVIDILEISQGTLQHLRDNGTLAHARIGRLFYYDPQDIEK